MKRALTVKNGGGWRFLFLGVLIISLCLPGDAGAAGQAGIAPGWVVFHPDAQVNFSYLSQHALRFRTVSPYYASIAYGGDHLYYAYQDAGGWHTETVDGAWGVGSGAALALDPSGYAHISYFDRTNGDLKYATNRLGSWYTETIATTGYVGKYSDIAIDAWGDPSIVYYNVTMGELHYINYDSDYPGWMEDQVVATGLGDANHPGWFSLAMDPTVYKPHVSYYEYTDATHGSLNWAHYDNSNNWVRATVEYFCVEEATTCKVGEYNSIALDPSTHYPSIAYSYYDAYAYDMILYSSYNGSSWTKDYNVPSTSGINYLSLGIDSSGHPHIAWNGYGMFYSQRESGTWSDRVTLDASLTAGQPLSLALSNDSAKVVSYNSATSNLAYLGRDRYLNWLSPVTIATQGHDVGRCTSLSLDKLGRGHISYFDKTNNHLLYTRYSGSSMWAMNSIDTSGTASCFSVIVANPQDNNPYVAYIANGDLYFKIGNGASWVFTGLVDNAVDYSSTSYQAFSFAIDSDGRPHILYRKGGNVWYAVYSTSWTKTQIATGPTGSYVALAIGPDKKPQAAFYQSNELRYRRYDGVSWQGVETIATAADGAGVGVALAAGPNNQPTVAFMNAGGTALRVSTRQCIPLFCGWTPAELVDDHAEDQFSLAVDRLGNPHLAAGALTDEGFRLDYITLKNGVWSLLAVDTNNSNGWFPSISLALDGMPRISYYDFYNLDLKFVIQLNRNYLPLIKK